MLWLSRVLSADGQRLAIRGSRNPEGLQNRPEERRLSLLTLRELSHALAKHFAAQLPALVLTLLWLLPKEKLTRHYVIKRIVRASCRAVGFRCLCGQFWLSKA